ncbi:hypothetical protein B9C88_17090 [Brevibacillus laterosporus]|uniref:hypothetical protein n=1 Tax=Brevibacillus laterosporus TaxID=1465 RepID=UPI000BDBD64C|nr:hypothetical protein [Brevibacillus laterosporus]PCN43165.1 hypothetical protein B9C88_17090 [Brevibacillus laterosporus]
MNNVDRYSVLNWMKKDKWMVRKDSSIREVMRGMVQLESTELPVIEKGSLLGEKSVGLGCRKDGLCWFL